MYLSGILDTYIRKNSVKGRDDKKFCRKEKNKLQEKKIKNVGLLNLYKLEKVFS